LNSVEKKRTYRGLSAAERENHARKKKKKDRNRAMSKREKEGKKIAEKRIQSGGGGGGFKPRGDRLHQRSTRPMHGGRVKKKKKSFVSCAGKDRFC